MIVRAATTAPVDHCNGVCGCESRSAVKKTRPAGIANHHPASPRSCRRRAVSTPQITKPRKPMVAAQAIRPHPAGTRRVDFSSSPAVTTPSR